jgi:hypothetical protein
MPSAKVLISVGVVIAVLIAVAGWYFRGVNLTLTTDPGGADVVLDAKFMGRTSDLGGSIVLPHLTHGSHTLNITRFGFNNWSQPISLGWFEFSHALTVPLPIPTYPLTIMTNPGGAKVQLDGKDAGVSDDNGNFSIPSVVRGQHTVTVIKEGFPSWSQALSISGPFSVRADLAEAAASQLQEINARLERAMSFIQQRQYDAATAECDAILGLDPTNQQASALKSQIQTVAAEIVAEENQRQIAAGIARARVLFQQRQYQAAITECDAVLQRDPSNQDAAKLKKQIQDTQRILGGR